MDETWRDRLEQAIKAKDTTNRAVSLKSGADASYLYKILRRGVEPTIDRMVAIADALDVSLSWLMYGVEFGPQEERLLRLFADLPEPHRQAILNLAATLAEKP